MYKKISSFAQKPGFGEVTQKSSVQTPIEYFLIFKVLIKEFEQKKLDVSNPTLIPNGSHLQLNSRLTVISDGIGLRTCNLHRFFRYV